MSSIPPVTERDLWATPQAVVDAVSDVMGSVPIVDLCAFESNAKAPHWIGEADSNIDRFRNVRGGLLSIPPAEVYMATGWSAWCWLNPPYSRGNLPRFTAWAAGFAEAGGTVALCVPASHSDSWWRDNVAPHARMILQPDRRIQFEPPPGVKPSSNSGQNAIVIMAPRRPWDGDTVVRRLYVQPATGPTGRTMAEVAESVAERWHGALAKIGEDD